MPNQRPRRGRQAIAISCLLSVLLAACAGPAQPTTAGVESAGAFPRTVDNCGFQVMVGEAPQRIVTVKSTTTELVAALGLADRIVGAAFLDEPVPDTIAGQDIAEIPVISDFLPNQESVLGLDPDLVFGGWESNFTADGVGERADLAARGIAGYVAPSACRQVGYRPAPMTFELLWDHITEAGDLLGAAPEAASLVSGLEAELAAVTPDRRKLRALWYSSGSDTPYVGAGIGAPQMMLQAAGLGNVFSGIDDSWASVSWEAVIEADPEVIVLVDATWNTADSKIEALESNPATASLAAVRQGRYLRIGFAGAEAGVRSPETVASLVSQLEAIDLGD